MYDFDQLLTIGGILFAILCILLIVVPYVLGWRDLFLPSSLFLGGSALFIGVSAYRSGTQGHMLTYPNDIYERLFIGFGVFYGVMFLTYVFWKFPRRLAGRIMRKWPAPSASALFFLSLFTTALSALALVPIPIPFLQQVTFHILLHLGPFAVVFALAAWHRDRVNPICLLNLVVVATIALVLSMSFGGGRRLLVGVVMVLPIYGYWAWLRYKPRTVVVSLMGLAVVIGYAYLEGYNRVRRRAAEETGVARAVESVRLAAVQAVDAGATGLTDIAQPGVEVTLLTIHTFVGSERSRDTSWFHGLYTIVSNPFPREFWDDKPVGLGYRLPKLGREIYDFSGYGEVVWSINCVAQGFHDGGLFPIAVYAVIAAFGLRFFDELMIRQPNNLFLIGMLATSSGHIVGFARGSMDVMSFQLIGCTLSLLFLWGLSRLLLGSQLEYPRTDHVLSYPNIGTLTKLIRSRQLG